jgi:hypothetical protein
MCGEIRSESSPNTYRMIRERAKDKAPQVRRGVGGLSREAAGPRVANEYAEMLWLCEGRVMAAPRAARCTGSSLFS